MGFGMTNEAESTTSDRPRREAWDVSSHATVAYPRFESPPANCACPSKPSTKSSGRRRSSGGRSSGRLRCAAWFQTLRNRASSASSSTRANFSITRYFRSLRARVSHCRFPVPSIASKKRALKKRGPKWSDICWESRRARAMRTGPPSPTGPKSPPLVLFGAALGPDRRATFGPDRRATLEQPAYWLTANSLTRLRHRAARNARPGAWQSQVRFAHHVLDCAVPEHSHAKHHPFCLRRRGTGDGGMREPVGLRLSRRVEIRAALLVARGLPEQLERGE